MIRCISLSYLTVIYHGLKGNHLKIFRNIKSFSGYIEIIRGVIDVIWRCYRRGFLFVFFPFNDENYNTLHFGTCNLCIACSIHGIVSKRVEWKTNLKVHISCDIMSGCHANNLSTKPNRLIDSMKNNLKWSNVDIEEC